MDRTWAGSSSVLRIGVAYPYTLLGGRGLAAITAAAAIIACRGWDPGKVDTTIDSRQLAVLKQADNVLLQLKLHVRFLHRLKKLAYVNLYSKLFFSSASSNAMWCPPLESGQLGQRQDGAATST